MGSSGPVGLAMYSSAFFNEEEYKAVPLATKCRSRGHHPGVPYRKSATSPPSGGSVGYLCC